VTETLAPPPTPTVPAVLAGPDVVAAPTGDADLAALRPWTGAGPAALGERASAAADAPADRAAEALRTAPSGVDDAARSASAPVGGGDHPVPPAPSAPAPSGTGASGSPLRTSAGQDVLAVLTTLALVLGGSRLLAVARGRVELPLRLRDVPVFPA